MAIILAHGGRCFASDNPTAETRLVAERYEMMARVVSPFLRAGSGGGSRRLPDVSLFHGGTDPLRGARPVPAAFPRQNAPLLAACEGLRGCTLARRSSDRRLEARATSAAACCCWKTPLYCRSAPRRIATLRGTRWPRAAHGQAIDAAPPAGRREAQRNRAEPPARWQGSGGPAVCPALVESPPPALPSIRLRSWRRSCRPPSDTWCATVRSTSKWSLHERTNESYHLVNIAPGKHRQHNPKGRSSRSSTSEIKELPPPALPGEASRAPATRLRDAPAAGRAAGQLDVERRPAGYGRAEFDVHQLVIVTRIKPWRLASQWPCGRVRGYICRRYRQSTATESQVPVPLHVVPIRIVGTGRGRHVTRSARAASTISRARQSISAVADPPGRQTADPKT